MAMFNEKVKGAVAFEYVIILVFMVAVIFAAWQKLTPTIIQKVNDIEAMMKNNGVNPAGNIFTP